MPKSFTGSALKDVYKDILQTNNSNTGIGASLKQITCGDGDETSLFLSKRQFKVQPSLDNTTSSAIYDKDGNALLVVDTTNDLVKLGIGQHTANTQYHQFGVFDFSPTAGEHHALMNNSWMPEVTVYTGEANGSAWGGTGTNPATSLTLASASHELVPALWLLQGNITIDEVNYMMGSDAASTINLHIMQYDMVAGSGSTAGDLSNGVVLAQTGSADDSLSPVTTGDDRVSSGTLTINTADVDSGKVIIAFAEASDTDDMTINLNIKYHLR